MNKPVDEQRGKTHFGEKQSQVKTWSNTTNFVTYVKDCTSLNLIFLSVMKRGKSIRKRTSTWLALGRCCLPSVCEAPAPEVWSFSPQLPALVDGTAGHRDLNLCRDNETVVKSQHTPHPLWNLFHRLWEVTVNYLHKDKILCNKSIHTRTYLYLTMWCLQDDLRWIQNTKYKNS